MEVKQFLKMKIGIECEIESVRINGPVIIVKIDKEEDKRRVMRNKNKLKEDKIFIKTDLSSADRKRQERIGKWVKKRKNIEKNVKGGYARVKIKEEWKLWDEVEK